MMNLRYNFFALAAKSMKLDAVRINDEARSLGHLFVYLFRHRYLDIHDSPALITDKMVMRFHIGIESVESVAKIHFINLPLFFKNLKIPIDCS